MKQHFVCATYHNKVEVLRVLKQHSTGSFLELIIDDRMGSVVHARKKRKLKNHCFSVTLVNLKTA